MAKRLSRNYRSHGKASCEGYDDEGDYLYDTIIDALENGDANKALTTLDELLALDPSIYSDVQMMFSALQYDPTFGPSECRAKRLDYLTKRLAERLTGAKVKILRSRSRPVGHPRTLFPHLGERDGSYETPAAEQEQADAVEFYRYVKDLHRWIRLSQPWRTIGREYRERPDATLDAVSYDTLICFEDFKRYHGLTGLPLTEADCRRVVQQGLNRVYIRRDISFDITCHLSTTLHLPCLDRQDGLVSPQLIKSTMRNLYDYFGEPLEEWVSDFFYTYNPSDVHFFY